MASRLKPILGKGAQKAISDAVDDLFDRIKVKFLHPKVVGSKGLRFTYQRDLSLPGMYETASEVEKTAPNTEVLDQLINIAGGYIDAVKERTKARVMKEVTSFLRDAHDGRVETDLETVLGGKLSDVYKDATTQVSRIIESETQHTKNVGVLDGIVKVNDSQGISDPTVFFVVVRDGVRCDECTRLHLLPNGVTPRVWKLSEVGHGYHKKGENYPKIAGLHPNCRCSMSTLLPDYSFNENGYVTFKSMGWDEFSHQRSVYGKL